MKLWPQIQYQILYWLHRKRTLRLATNWTFKMNCMTGSIFIAGIWVQSSIGTKFYLPYATEGIKPYEQGFEPYYMNESDWKLVQQYYVSCQSR